MKGKPLIGVGTGGSAQKLRGEALVVPEKKKDESVVPEQQVHQAKTGFTALPVHQTITDPATQQGHVVPIGSRNKADPLFGATETKSERVSEKIPTPRRPEGYSPRSIWQETINMGTGHDDARKLIGNPDALAALKGIGFDLPIAMEWRDFFHGIDTVSTEKGKPNPSAKGRAEFADWVVMQLGGASAGFWTGAAA